MKRCGPILEVIDEYVHFVHFSAKELAQLDKSMERLADSSCRYLFSSQSSNYLKIGNANLSIVKTCLKYLRSNCLNPTISDDEMLAGIERGAYVLLEYVASYWLDHIIRACSNGLPSQDLVDLTQEITKVIGTRQNQAFVSIQAPRRLVPALGVFADQSKIVFETLLEVCSSNQRKRIEYSLLAGNATAL